MMAGAYHAGITSIIARIGKEQLPAIQRVGGAIAETIRLGALLHIFGSGHSHMAAEEVFHRAGGLCGINAILDPALSGHGPFGTHLERLEGYVPVVLSQYDLRAGEHLIVVSNSGINAAPVEAALYGKAHGLVVTAITSLAHSRAVASRHSSGRKLYEIADDIIDNCGPAGDALLDVEGVPERICATSTATTAVIMNMLMAEIVHRLVTSGTLPPVLRSANLPGKASGYQERCAALEERIKMQAAYSAR
jgi:uncharacterized phosphosugar-binding protein